MINDVSPEMTGRIEALTIMHILGAASVADLELEGVLQDSVQLVSSF